MPVHHIKTLKFDFNVAKSGEREREKKSAIRLQSNASMAERVDF